MHLAAELLRTMQHLHAGEWAGMLGEWTAEGGVAGRLGGWAAGAGLREASAVESPVLLHVAPITCSC